ncbi:prepilin peptidase [Thiomicrorhabdus sediminis]|uniref:Prepilin leader peptidase/N-methyltransferase n=1 Tax=Thiomicrorhabdus sediminis TaxID=2580412 RepID=A0A4P9K5Z0_9GAMM|nr:A24 family peptidase [Thiomicrorhabdus sediminis]QCU90399.1 prepilin peptidase [Thiomicrorhabdus sediminis]
MDAISSLPLGGQLLLSGIIALVVGSFISMLSYRLPKHLLENSDEPVLKTISVGGSKCPKCGSNLPWYRLIPVFSWLASKGRCHHCGNPISARYPLIELSTLLLTLACVWQFGLGLQGIAAIAFSWILLTISVIDIEHQLILDNLSLPLMWLGLLLSTQGTFTDTNSAIWGAATGYLLLWLVFHSFKLLTGKEGMGYGDFKLLAALGAWFGIAALAQIILIAAISSIVITVTAILAKGRDKSQPMAFGPFLAIAGWVSLFFGSELFG